jgi:hypothetical protein
LKTCRQVAQPRRQQPDVVRVAVPRGSHPNVARTVLNEPRSAVDRTRRARCVLLPVQCGRRSVARAKFSRLPRRRTTHGSTMAA